MKKLLLTFMTGALIISCDSEKKDVDSVDTTAPTVETTDVAVEEDINTAVEDTNEGVSNTVTIEGTDQMTYNKDEIRVKAGEPVTLTLKHVGKMPESTMGHNWVLLKQGTDIADFAMEAMKAKDNDYVPADTDVVIAHTEVIGGGEEATITFDAPEAGTYDFICSFPGHYGAMQGKFIVE